MTPELEVILWVAGVVATILGAFFVRWVVWISAKIVEILTTLEELQTHREGQGERIDDHEDRIRVVEQRRTGW